MNERIRELDKQVSASPALLSHDEYLEKLARLIVQECASICRERRLAPSVFTADELLEHFGVQE